MSPRIRLAAIVAIWSLSLSASGATPSVGPYLSVQAGYSWGSDANFKEDNPNSPDCFIFTGAACGGTLNNLGSSPVFGIGIGYRFSPMFRADISYQKRSGYNLSGYDPAGTYFDPDVSSDAVMLAGYYDIPHKIAGKAQPYVGVAIGRSKNKMDALNWNDPGCCMGTLNGGGSNNSTAYQLTLGAAWTVANNWVLDVAYRYTDLGDFKKPAGADQSGNFTGTGVTTSATGKLRGNELILGLRYEFH